MKVNLTLGTSLIMKYSNAIRNVADKQIENNILISLNGFIPLSPLPGKDIQFLALASFF